MLVGLALCSHNPDVVERAVFSNVRIIRPAKDGFVPYRDYIGSLLELLDVQTGRGRRSTAPTPFEAPNWTPDGSALIFNGSGRGEVRGKLFRFDLATRQPALDRHRHREPQQQRPRALVRRHDARHQRPERRPVDHLHGARGGGTPKRITPLTPSYLHGWSPDAKRLVYTGGRNNEYDIYAIPSDGSGPSRT